MIRGLRTIETITLFATDLDASRAFYRNVFDARAIFEDEHCTVFDFGGVRINLLGREHAHELTEPTPLGDVDGRPRMLLTIVVEDVDDICRQLEAEGVVLINGPIDRPWGRRTACFADPDGVAWEIAGSIGCPTGDKSSDV